MINMILQLFVFLIVDLNLFVLFACLVRCLLVLHLFLAFVMVFLFVSVEMSNQKESVYL